MANLVRILIISLLVGIVVGGALWYIWGGVRAGLAARRKARQLDADAENLLKTARDAGDGE